MTAKSAAKSANNSREANSRGFNFFFAPIRSSFFLLHDRKDLCLNFDTVASTSTFIQGNIAASFQEEIEGKIYCCC